MAYIENLTAEELQQKGKEEYDLYSAKDKIDTLVKKNRINTNLDSLSIAENCIRDKRDFCAFTLGTTGIRPDDEIMQIGFANYSFNPERNRYEKTDFFMDIVRASDVALSHYRMDFETAVKTYEDRMQKFRNGDLKLEPKKPELYDIFKEGGFGRPVEENGVGISEEAYRTVLQVYLKDRVPDINKFIEKHKTSLFFGLNLSFADKFLIPAGIDMRSVEKCDVLDVIREYDFRAFRDETPDKVFNRNGRNYGLADIIGQYECKANNGDYKLYSTANKNDAIASAIRFLSEKEHLLENAVQNKNKKPVQEKKTKEEKVNPHSLSVPVEGELSTNLRFRGRLSSEIGKEIPKAEPSAMKEKKEAEQAKSETKAEGSGEAFDRLSDDMKAYLTSKETELKAREEMLQKMLDKLVETFCAVEEISKSNKELVTTVKNMSKKITSLEKAVSPEKEAKPASEKPKTSRKKKEDKEEAEKLPDDTIKEDDDYER